MRALSSAASMSSEAVAVDVLVIGGGLQGLLVLDRVAGAGLSCALVTQADLGTGQTLHSHGVLNTGFGMAGPEPVQLLSTVVLPDLARRGVRHYGEWSALTPPGSPQDASLPPPPWLDLRGRSLQPLHETNVNRRELVAAVARGLEDRIVRGAVSAVQRGADGDIVAVEVAGDGMPRSVLLAPAVVVVAAGVGSKAVLRRLGAAESQLAAIKHRPVHVLCVRGAASVLPQLNLVSFIDTLFIASHETGGETTWYATPMQFDAQPVDDVPGDAAAECDEAVVERGWEVLLRLYPPLASMPGLRFASYAGFRQDVGDTPGVPMCARLEAAPNVIAALPSGLLGAWPVAARVLALAKEIIHTGRPQPPIPAAGVDIRVGGNHEDGAGISWTRHLPASSGLRYTSASAHGRA